MGMLCLDGRLELIIVWGVYAASGCLQGGWIKYSYIQGIAYLMLRLRMEDIECCRDFSGTCQRYVGGEGRIRRVAVSRCF